MQELLFFYGGYAGTVLSGKEFFLCFAMKISGSLCLGA